MCEAIESKEIPFVLACFECEAGDEVETIEEAVLSGWRAICEDADGVTWNQLGWCPACGPLYHSAKHWAARKGIVGPDGY